MPCAVVTPCHPLGLCAQRTPCRTTAPLLNVVLRYEEVSVATAHAVRAVLRGPRLASVDGLATALLVPNCPLRALLELVLAVRGVRRPSRDRSLAACVRLLPGWRQVRWLRVAQQRTYGIYCALRRAAVPSAARGAAQHHERLSVPFASP